MILQAECAFGAAKLIVRRGNRLHKRSDGSVAGRIGRLRAGLRIGFGEQRKAHGFTIGKHPSGRAIDEVVEAPHDGAWPKYSKPGTAAASACFTACGCRRSAAVMT